MSTVGVPGATGAGDPRRPKLTGRIAAAVTWLFEVSAMILMALMAALVFANAVSRYALSRPLPWSEEVVTNLMVWLVAVGVVLAGMRQALICCDILTARLKPATYRILFIACSVIGAAAMAYTAWLTWEYLQFFGADRSPVLRMPKGIMIGAIFFALIGLTTTLVAAMFKKV